MAILPIDPVNSTSTYFYSYTTNGTSYEVSRVLESTKYQSSMSSDGGSDSAVYQAGNYIGLTPSFRFASSSATSSIPEGIVGWWKFDDGSGTTAADSSGYSRNGTFVGTPSWVSGKIGGATQFDGSTNSVTLPTMSISGDKTISAWIKLDTINRRNIIFGKYGFWAFYVEDNNRIAGYGGGWYYGTTLSANTWYHVAITMDRDVSPPSYVVYVNGVSQGTWTGMGSNDISGVYSIGDQYSGAEHMAGIIDDLRYYNRDLSQAEVQAIYEAGL